MCPALMDIQNALYLLDYSYSSVIVPSITGTAPGRLLCAPRDGSIRGLWRGLARHLRAEVRRPLRARGAGAAALGDAEVHAAAVRRDSQHVQPRRLRCGYRRDVHHCRPFAVRAAAAAKDVSAACIDSESSERLINVIYGKGHPFTPLSRQGQVGDCCMVSPAALSACLMKSVTSATFLNSLPSAPRSNTCKGRSFLLVCNIVQDYSEMFPTVSCHVCAQCRLFGCIPHLDAGILAATVKDVAL